MEADNSHGAAPPPAAALRAVSKRLGKTQVLHGLDLVVPGGETTALLGPNGAGKTTSVNILLGLRRPDSGEVMLLGGAPTEPSRRRLVGWTPQQATFPATLRVEEVVRFVRAHHTDPLDVDDVLERCLLKGVAGRQCGGLSGGQSRRLAFALAIVGRPALLVLDEPSAGLDLEARGALWEQITDHQRRGGTVLLTTHDLHEADRLASNVAIIAGGRIVRAGTPTEVKKGSAAAVVEFEAESEVELRRLPTVTRVERTGRRVRMWTADTDGLVRALVGEGVGFENLRVSPVSLEEAVSSAYTEGTSGG